MVKVARFAAMIVAALVGAGCSAPAPQATSAPSAPASVMPTRTASPAAAVSPYRPVGDPTVAATGLDAPWSVVPLSDGTQLVSQWGTGTVIEVVPGGRTREIGAVPDVVPGGEGGLHGLAVLEDDARTWLYAYHGTSGDNRVVRMPLTGARGALGLGAPETVITGIPRAGNHNGGRIAFGPDGLLYVSTGDAGLRDAAQDAASLAGKILRVTPEGDAAPGNPDGTAVYSLGHRNVQGLAWTADGTMWASEFGQNTFDEINRIEAGGNYGWPVHEGASGDAAFLDPLVTWAPSDASPSGLAAAGGTLFVAGLRGERVWMIDVAGGALVGEPTALWTGRYGRMRDAVVAGDELWLLTNNSDGRGVPAADDDRLLRVTLEQQS